MEVNLKRLKKAAASVMAACMAFALAGTLAGCTSGEEYTPELGPAKVEPPTIGEAGTLRVGVNTNNSPLAGKSGNKIIGIDVDVAAALADELGLAVNVVDVGSDGAEAIEAGEVDVVLGVESSTKDTGCWISNQYLQTGVALFQETGSNLPTPTAESSIKVAAQVSSKSAWAVTNVFGEDALESTTDLANAFTDLGSGKVSYVASDAIIGMYAASRQNVDVEIAALLESATGYCAMASSENLDLQTAITEALDAIVGNGIIDVIEDKWLNHTVDLSTVQKISSKPDASTNVTEGEGGANGTEGATTAGGAGSSAGSSASSSSASSSAAASSSRSAAA